MPVRSTPDLENPVEVARFEVPEAGSHNLWIEGDVLYAAFYNAGLRIASLLTLMDKVTLDTGRRCGIVDFELYRDNNL